MTAIKPNPTSVSGMDRFSPNQEGGIHTARAEPKLKTTADSLWASVLAIDIHRVANVTSLSVTRAGFLPTLLIRAKPVHS